MTRGKTIHISGPQPGSFFFKSWIKDTTYKSRESKKKKMFLWRNGKIQRAWPQREHVRFSSALDQCLLLRLMFVASCILPWAWVVGKLHGGRVLLPLFCVRGYAPRQRTTTGRPNDSPLEQWVAPSLQLAPGAAPRWKRPVSVARQFSATFALFRRCFKSLRVFFS